MYMVSDQFVILSNSLTNYSTYLSTRSPTPIAQCHPLPCLPPPPRLRLWAVPPPPSLTIPSSNVAGGLHPSRSQILIVQAALPLQALTGDPRPLSGRPRTPPAVH